MFDSKQKKLFDNSKKNTSGDVMTVNANPFVQAGLKKQAGVKSGNGSAKFSTTGNDFVDQFGTTAQYLAPRPYNEMDKDMRKLWGVDAKTTVAFILFIRMITRVVSLFNNKKTESVQKGAGLRHEGTLRMLWLAINAPDTFWKNVQLYISVGSWRDIITMLSYDLQYNGWNNRQLDWEKFGNLLLVGLENPNHTQLIRKWLPQIKSNTKCTTIESQADNMIAKWICSLLYGSKENGATYKKYRKLKSSGTAHQWQQLISQKKFNKINFDSIHGRALALLASSKFLKNHGLEAKYAEWIGEKPTAKFTGFVYELAAQVKNSLQKYQKDTINAQYQTLLENATVNIAESPYRPIAVLDGSGSMDSKMYIGNGKVGDMSSWNAAYPLAIFLDDMLQSGPFKGHYLQFSNTCEMIAIKGATFVDKVIIRSRGSAAGTNFMSVFDLIIGIKRANPKLDESNFPNMIVCFSDGEFNSVGSNITNVEKGRQMLKQAGFSKEYYESFGFCFVDMPNTFYSNRRDRKPKFESFGGNVKNCFYFSGYDLAPLGFLFGQSKVTERVPTTAEELFQAAMDQEVMQHIEI